MFASKTVTRCSLRRQVLYWSDRQWGLLSSNLPSAYCEREERPLLSDRRGSSGGRLSPLPALPARKLARNSGMAGNFKHGFASFATDRRERVGGWRGRVLAERLGVGSRHLRRLFLRHLGATPVAVAQTRRLHFAKKLIDETSLPMGQIALASGFGCVRRFNASVRNVYHRTPTQIRSLARQTVVQPGNQYRFRLISAHLIIGRVCWRFGRSRHAWRRGGGTW